MASVAPNPTEKRGTLAQILKYFLGIQDPVYVDIFLVCYRRWFSTEELFSALDVMASPSSCGLYPQLPLFLNQWINIHLRGAFLEGPLSGAGKEEQERIATKVLNITNTLHKADYEEEANRLKLTMIRVNKELIKRPSKGNSTPLEKHIEYPKGPLKLSTFLSRKVAEQLTLLESRMFKNIQMQELYSRAWTKDTKDKEAHNIMAMINHATKVSHWVASLILNQKDESSRLRAVQRVVTIASSCLELKNYNSVMEIVGGLSMWPVARILKGMKIPKRFVQKMKSFHTLFDQQKNWKNYREAILKDRETDLPVLPYLGVFLTDIVFLDDGNPDYFENKDVNFEKIVLMGSQLLSLQSFQKCNFNNLVKEKDSTILKYLTNLPTFNEEKLEKLSNDIKVIPEEHRTRKLPIEDWDSAELSTEDDSYSEEPSENDFDELSSTSNNEDMFREIFGDDDSSQHPRLK